MPGWFDYIIISWVITAILAFINAVSPWLVDLIRFTLAFLIGSLIPVYIYFWILAAVSFPQNRTAETTFMETIILLMLLGLLAGPALLVLGFDWLPYLAGFTFLWLLLMLPGHLRERRSAAAWKRRKQPAAPPDAASDPSER